jgi:hypothetical protein
MPTNVMLDLETLAVSPDAVVLSIAAVEFNPFEVTKDFSKLKAIQILLDIDDQVQNYQRKVDDSTVEWWGNQAQEVQDVIFSDVGRVSLVEGLSQLTKFCWNKSRIWAQGPQFDMTILEHMYKQSSVSPAWKYWQIRDARTVLDLFPVEQPVVTHDSIEDCKRQIVGTQKVLSELKITKFVK